LKAAIFDLDGTILDSMHVWRDIDIRFLAKRGFEVSRDYIEQVSSMGFEESARFTIQRFGLKERAEDIQKEWFDMAIDAYTNDVLLKPHAKEYLEYLGEEGIKIAAATSSDSALVLPALKNNKIFHLFDEIVTVREVERGKGFPDIYIHAAKKLKVPISDCVVFEDIIKGIIGAHDGGFYAIAMEDTNSCSEKERMQAEADAYIVDFAEMMRPFHLHNRF